MIIQKYYNEDGYSNNCYVAKQGELIAYAHSFHDAIKRLIAIIRSLKAWQ